MHSVHDLPIPWPPKPDFRPGPLAETTSMLAFAVGLRFLAESRGDDRGLGGLLRAYEDALCPPPRPIPVPGPIPGGEDPPRPEEVLGHASGLLALAPQIASAPLRAALLEKAGALVEAVRSFELRRGG